jgi:hypothetical protein
MGESAGGTTPPQTINVEGKNVIQQVISRRNGGKHLAHGLRS